jgi:hypothetical protein
MRCVLTLAALAIAGVSEAAAQAAAAQARADTSRMTIEREVFTYSAGGRRDPMVSLAGTGDIRPLITEIELVAIIYDEGGSNHMALIRNIKDKRTQYRVRVGQMIGRLRVTQITRREVVFAIDEFGFSRQQRLSVRPDTTARTP